MAGLLQQAAAAAAAADDALAARDLARYEQQIDRALDLVAQANALAGAARHRGLDDHDEHHRAA